MSETNAGGVAGVRDASPLLTWLYVFGAVALLAYLIEGAAKGATWALYAGVVSIPRPDAERIDLVATYTGYVLAAAFWLCAFVTLRLIYRLTKNLHKLGAEGDLPGPGWAIGVWFIPLVNLVMPPVIVGDLWRRSFKLTGQDKNSAIIGIWWALWIITAILSIIAAFITRGSHQPDANVSREAHTIALALVTLYLGGRALCVILLLAIFAAIVRAQKSVGDVSTFD